MAARSIPLRVAFSLSRSIPSTMFEVQVDVEDRSAAALAMIRGMLNSAGYMRTSNIPLNFYAEFRSDSSTTVTSDTHPKERYKLISFQISRLGVSKLCPNLLEIAHLLARDGFRATRHLEDIVETLDDNT